MEYTCKSLISLYKSDNSGYEPLIFLSGLVRGVRPDRGISGNMRRRINIQQRSEPGS